MYVTVCGHLCHVCVLGGGGALAPLDLPLIVMAYMVTCSLETLLILYILVYCRMSVLLLLL